MQDLLDRIYHYAEDHSTPPDLLLVTVERATHLETLAPRMLSGHLQGNLLSLLSQIQRPAFILEIGTFTGYSALCLAKGLLPGGKLISIEYDAQHAELASKFVATSVYAENITIMVGDAKKMIPDIDMIFDLIFIDADKEGYSEYFDLIIDKCRPGALIIADNVLWSGKVLDEIKDRKTQHIYDFNLKIMHDPRVENVILPLRDGINLMIRK